jgi:Uma2 family endonuclease
MLWSVRPLRRAHPATREDLEALPPGVLGEVIDGVLYAMTRPRSPHGRLLGTIASDLLPPYDRGRGGPGGWWILPEPGIELPGSAEVVPDLAGWRRERLPTLPANASITLAPDWVCEILSPSTRNHDLRIKRPFYARSGVKHLWYVDSDARTVTISRLEGGRWVELGVFGDEDRMRAEPFAEVELALGDWWLPEP